MQATEIGAAKANLPVSKIFALSILGGFFIAFGGALAISVGPACPGLASSNPGLLKILTGKHTHFKLFCTPADFTHHPVVLTAL